MTRWHSSVSVCVLACAAVLQTINPPCSSPAVAGSPWHNVVRRTTNDRDEDLIRSLLLLRRFDDAETICREQIQRAVPTSDAAAKWAIRWSSVMTERQISKEQFDDADVSQAEQPVVELLSGYPNHRRKLFLQAQRVSVQHAAARHDVVIAAVSPANEKRTEAVFTRLARVTQRYRELATQVDAERAATDAGPTSLDQKNRSAELTRLQHELQVDIVSMALMQTELFPPDSRDQIASASKAEQAAADALLDLPTGSQAQKEIERLRIQAMILAGKLDQAGPSLVALIRASEQPTPPSLLAIQIQLHQLKNESSLAEKRLAEFYGSEPDEAPFSIEMDLVRLDHLIRQNDSSIGSWLTSIQRRNGDYARRRAEAISLAKLRSGGSSESIDPSIVAAQGKEWLRRDNPSRGGDLLAAAADAESDSQLALNYAMESAAALLKAQRVEDAASVLSRIAVAHPNAKDAAAAHLQAAVLLSSVDQPKITKTIERLLIQAHQQWPDSSAAQQARRWLITLLTRQGRAEDAAKQATSFLNSSSTVLQVDHALSLWMNLIHNSDPSQTEQWIETFESAFAPLLKHSNIAERYPLAAVYLIEPDSLDSLPATIQATTAEQQFAAALLAWRRRPTESAGLAAPPAQRLQAAQWRLMRDATLDPKRRSAVAQTLLSWPGQSPPQQAAVLIWNNQTKQAIDAIESAAQTSQQPGELWRKLARALASTNRRDDQTEAIKIWDRLASGLPKGSDRWHEAKIAAIELLRHSGDPEQASRRAKYILLTDPPSNPQHALQYKSASSP